MYDLTSTYVEGEAEQIPRAKRGYGRGKRFDCQQVIIALVVTPQGFPLAYEVMDGNTSDRTTLRGFLETIERLYGKARRTQGVPRMMDRGIPAEEVLAKSEGRRAKESAIRRQKLVRLLRKLRVTPQNFTWRLDKVKLKQAELRDGHYLPPTNLTGEAPAVLWDHYIWRPSWGAA